MLPPGEYASTKYVSSNTGINRTVRACVRCCTDECMRVFLHGLVGGYTS